MLAEHAVAATFVGNGGSVSDHALNVTLAEIAQTAQGLDDSEGQLCTCPDAFQNNPLCKTILSMNKAERKFCKETLLKNKRQLVSLATKDIQDRFRWAENVKLKKHKGAKKVDAVANVDEDMIVIDKTNFDSLTRSERIALIVHELFHLIPIEERYLSDDEEVPPFASGRELLDTLGAALAVEANTSGVTEELGALANVSMATKRHHFHLYVKSVKSEVKFAKTFGLRGHGNGTEFGYEYRINGFGLGFGSDFTYQSGTIAEGISTAKNDAMVYAGLSYSMRPFEDSFTSWGQAQIEIQARYLAGSSDYKAKDSYAEITDESSVKGVQGSLLGRYPLSNGFWLMGGGYYRQLSYKFKLIKEKQLDQQYGVTFGGAYGF